MKKIVVSLLLVAILLMSGCGTPQSLSFTNAWNGGNEVPLGFTETQTYKVEFTDKYTSGDYVLDKHASLVNAGVNYEFTNGSYVTTLSVLSNNTSLPNGASDILTGYTGVVIEYKTLFTIDVKYSCSETTFKDRIETKTYFCNSGSSFAPFYSFTDNLSSLLSYSTDNVKAEQIHSVNAICYNKADYKIYEYSVAPDAVFNPEAAELKGEIKTYNYDYKTAVDNAQLLFAMRNVTVTTEASATLPTVAATYGNAQNLEVKNYQENFTEQITVNGTTADCEIKCLSYVISSSASGCFGGGTSNTGRAQLVFLQAKENDALTANRAQIVKYVTPLTAYSSFYLMGALVYTLTDYTSAQA